MPGGFITAGGLIAGIITVGAGILILVWPRIIAYIIGIYLILAGLFAIMAVLR
jgi:hypothetical protein